MKYSCQKRKPGACTKTVQVVETLALREEEGARYGRAKNQVMRGLEGIQRRVLGQTWLLKVENVESRWSLMRLANLASLCR